MPRRKKEETPEIEKETISNKQETDRETLGITEESSSGEIEETIKKVNELLETDTEAKIYLYKKNELNKKIEFVDVIYNLDTDFLVYIKNEYGGGDYIIKLQKNGKFVSIGKSSFSIKRSAAKKTDSKNSELEMLEKMKMYKELFSDNKNAGADVMMSAVMSSVKNLIDFQTITMKQTQDFFKQQIEDLKEEKESGETNIYDVLAGLSESLPMLMNKENLKQIPQQTNQTTNKKTKIKELKNKIILEERFNTMKILILSFLQKNKEFIKDNIDIVINYLNNSFSEFKKIIIEKTPAELFSLLTMYINLKLSDKQKDKLKFMIEIIKEKIK